MTRSGEGRASRGFPPVSARTVEALTAAMVSKLLHALTLARRQYGAKGNASAAIAAVRELFGSSELADSGGSSEAPQLRRAADLRARQAAGRF